MSNEQITTSDLALMHQIFTDEQVARMCALQAVAPIIRREVREPGKNALTAGGVTTKLNVLDLHALAQWIVDGKDPWTQERIEEITEPGIRGTWSLGSSEQPAFARTARVTEDDHGVRVTLYDGDPDRTKDLAGEPVDEEDTGRIRALGTFEDYPDADVAGVPWGVPEPPAPFPTVDEDGGTVNVREPHTHPNEGDKQFIWRDELGKCVEVEVATVEHHDGDGPE